MSYEWMDEAVCAQTDPALFFPEVGRTGAAAKRICAGCPVRTQCEDHAQHLEGGAGEQLRHGTWAAASPKQRATKGGESKEMARDRAILRLTGRGMTLAAVADMVGCSDRTVLRTLAAHRTQGVAA